MDWDNEAVWAAMSVGGRDEFRQWPISARIGVSRALINANIPFEYVTASDLRQGLAGRYRIIYLPFVISLAKDMMDILSRYVEDGGRLVIDMPSAWYDEFTALMSTDRGTPFEETFGVTIDGCQYAGTNRPGRLGELELHGFTADLTPTHTRVLARYDDGRPAITEAQAGKGTAVLLGYEASMMCFEPGNGRAEAMLLRHTLGRHKSPYSCDEAIVYRLAAPSADHYFLINDGPAKRVHLNVPDRAYSRAIDAVTQEPMPLGQRIRLEGYDGRWLRFDRSIGEE